MKPKTRTDGDEDEDEDGEKEKDDEIRRKMKIKMMIKPTTKTETEMKKIIWDIDLRPFASTHENEHMAILLFKTLCTSSQCENEELHLGYRLETLYSCIRRRRHGHSHQNTKMKKTFPSGIWT